MLDSNAKLSAEFFGGFTDPLGAGDFTVSNMVFSALFNPLLGFPFVSFAPVRVSANLTIAGPGASRNYTEDAIHTISDPGGTLELAGWTRNPALDTFAVGDFWFAWVGGGDFSGWRGVLMIVNGTTITCTGGTGGLTYDPGSDTVTVPVGTTALFSQTQIALAVATYTSFTASYYTAGIGTVITLTASVAGPSLNYVPFVGSNSSNDPTGGALAWTSQAVGNGSQITVAFTSAYYWNGYNLNVIEVFPDGSSSTQPLGWWTTKTAYTFVANNYGFALIGPGETFGYTTGFYFTQCPNLISPDSAFADWQTSREFYSTSGHAELNGSSVVAANGVPICYSVLSSDNVTESGYGFIIYNEPLRTKADNKLVYSSLIGLPYTDGTVYLCGYLWDCVVVCDTYPINTLISWADHTWICLATQYSQSLFLCVA